VTHDAVLIAQRNLSACCNPFIFDAFITKAGALSMNVIRGSSGKYPYRATRLSTSRDQRTPLAGNCRKKDFRGRRTVLFAWIGRGMKNNSVVEMVESEAERITDDEP
jgi:hypothetical protein